MAFLRLMPLRHGSEKLNPPETPGKCPKSLRYDPGMSLGTLFPGVSTIFAHISGVNLPLPESTALVHYGRH